LSATLPPSIDTDAVFSDYGIDSIQGVGFVDRINARLAIR
jgi:acyl carrier protein